MLGAVETKQKDTLCPREQYGIPFSPSFCHVEKIGLLYQRSPNCGGGVREVFRSSSFGGASAAGLLVFTLAGARAKKFGDHCSL